MKQRNYCPAHDNYAKLALSPRHIQLRLAWLLKLGSSETSLKHHAVNRNSIWRPMPKFCSFRLTAIIPISLVVRFRRVQFIGSAMICGFVTLKIYLLAASFLHCSSSGPTWRAITFICVFFTNNHLSSLKTLVFHCCCSSISFTFLFTHWTVSSSPSIRSTKRDVAKTWRFSAGPMLECEYGFGARILWTAHLRPLLPCYIPRARDRPLPHNLTSIPLLAIWKIKRCFRKRRPLITIEPPTIWDLQFENK